MESFRSQKSCLGVMVAPPLAQRRVRGPPNKRRRRLVKWACGDPARVPTAVVLKLVFRMKPSLSDSQTKNRPAQNAGGDQGDQGTLPQASSSSWTRHSPQDTAAGPKGVLEQTRKLRSLPTLQQRPREGRGLAQGCTANEGQSQRRSQTPWPRVRRFPEH